MIMALFRRSQLKLCSTSPGEIQKLYSDSLNKLKKLRYVALYGTLEDYYEP